MKHPKWESLFEVLTKNPFIATTSISYVIEKNNIRLCSSTFKSPIIGEFDRRILRKKNS